MNFPCFGLEFSARLSLFSEVMLISVLLTPQACGMTKHLLGKLRVFFKQNKGDPCILRYTQSEEGQKFLSGSQGARRHLRGDSEVSSWLRTHFSSLWTETKQDSLLILLCRRRQLLTSCKGVTSKLSESSWELGVGCCSSQLLLQRHKLVFKTHHPPIPCPFGLGLWTSALHPVQ